MSRTTIQIQEELDDTREDIAMLRDRERKLKKELEASLFPDEPTGPGLVVSFGIQFNNGGIRYRYAAVAANSHWYVTGSTIKRTWNELVNWIRTSQYEGSSTSIWVSQPQVSGSVPSLYATIEGKG